MTWITADEMSAKRMIPCNFYDANGVMICRAITRANCVTGEVESEVRDANSNVVIDHENGEILKRMEIFPAPLTWNNVTWEEVEGFKYWDLEGR